MRYSNTFRKKKKMVLPVRKNPLAVEVWQSILQRTDCSVLKVMLQAKEKRTKYQIVNRWQLKGRHEHKELNHYLIKSAFLNRVESGKPHKIWSDVGQISSVEKLEAARWPPGDDGARALFLAQRRRERLLNSKDAYSRNVPLASRIKRMAIRHEANKCLNNIFKSKKNKNEKNAWK